MASHYDTLGVKPKSTTQEIRKAYLRRARVLHPDRQLGRSPTEARTSEQAMQQVNVAWNVLSDPKKKADYDKTLRARLKQSLPGPARATQPAARQEAQRTKPTGTTGQSQSRSMNDEPGDGSVSVWASIPVLLLLGLVLGILIVTAFADNRTQEPPPTTPSTQQLDVEDCFAFIGNTPRERSCASGTADGLVVATGPDSGNCPENSQSLKDPTSEFFLCWKRMIPGSSNTVAGG
ncbi:MAG: curved DNA-binding protein CbpA [Verrucomicrobiales bacterium]|jgi:curved DNA-binding protein CbpA